MMKHRFAAGERVEVLPSRTSFHVRPGIYTIVRAMPVSGDTCQYRAKSVMDEHERVFDEGQLHPVASSSKAVFGRGGA
jgi:hypothetical protein